MSKPVDRLDAAESVFFKRQLESIDATTYRAEYADLKARSLLPTVAGVHPDLPVYTYRGLEYKFADGGAKPIANGADDLPRADVVGSEASQLIKEFGASFGYDLSEIRIAAALGMDLDGEKARSCRRMLEEKLDEILALGSSALGLTGLLGLSNTTSFTPGDKVRGGKTWGSLAAPNATGDEMAADIMGICTTIHEATKERFNRFTVVLPTEQYNVASMTRLRDGSDVTALDFARSKCPYIAEVVSWNRCNAAGAQSADRMMAYPKDPRVIGALIPRDYTQQAPQQRNLSFIVNATMRTGGVVCRYPVACAYGDGV